jgi:hypothetical protein
MISYSRVVLFLALVLVVAASTGRSSTEADRARALKSMARLDASVPATATEPEMVHKAEDKVLFPQLIEISDDVLVIVRETGPVFILLDTSSSESSGAVELTDSEDGQATTTAFVRAPENVLEAEMTSKLRQDEIVDPAFVLDEDVDSEDIPTRHKDNLRRHPRSDKTPINTRCCLPFGGAIVNFLCFPLQKAIRKKASAVM